MRTRYTVRVHSIDTVQRYANRDVFRILIHSILFHNPIGNEGFSRCSSWMIAGSAIFGNRKLKDITTSDVSAFLTGLTCKPLTAKKIKIVFHSILKFAVSQKYISSNPCGGAIWQESVEREYGEIENVLTLQQAQKMMDMLSEYSIFNTIVKLLMLTGMRSGECLGLRWNSIDFERRTIFIDKTLSYANNQWFLSSPKTPRSTRTIVLDESAMEILLVHKAEQPLT